MAAAKQCAPADHFDGAPDADLIDRRSRIAHVEGTGSDTGEEADPLTMADTELGSVGALSVADLDVTLVNGHLDTRTVRAS
jgi:hypothetical protein